MKDEESLFWIAIWRLVGACFCVIVVSLSSCSMFKTHTKGELVKAGKDPLEVRCLWESDQSDPICTLIASMPKK